MGIEKEKYPYPGYQKYYQLTNGVKNSNTTPSSHENRAYYNKKQIDGMIQTIVSKINNSKHVVTETTSFANLPNPSEENAGYIYNIEDAFISDERFLDGPNKGFPADTNVIVVFDSDSGQYKYDVMMGEIGEASQEDIQDIIDSL